ncbi:MFS transporter [Lysobacter korlensis]|uniref:MFS transporter n=1 Tax=Lysobacter korlensis TaxID=553636 RepID=A0ABV6RW19_9GAMM
MTGSAIAERGSDVVSDPQEPQQQIPERWKRNVALFLTGQTVSLFGSMIVQYAVMWYVTFETGSGFAVALYAIAAFAPQGVVSLFGGVLADRMNRRVLAIGADAVIAAVTLVLATAMLLGVTDMWVILLAVAARSLGAGVQTPAVTAMIPQVTPPDQLMRVNGLFATIQSAMALIAPAAAGALFGLLGIVPVFFLDVATAVVGIGFLARVRVQTLAAVAESTTSFREDLVEGMRYIRHNAVVRWLLLVFAFIVLLTGAPSMITPLLVARTFGAEVWMVTVLELAFSVGMLAGGALVSTVLAKRGKATLIVVSSFGFGVCTIALGLAPDLWAFYGFMFAFGLMVPVFSTPFMTLLAEIVEPEKHGRVFSYVGIAIALAVPVGMAVFGPLADLVSVELLLVAAGVLMTIVLVLAMRAPSGRAALARASRAPSAEADDSSSVGAPA